MLALVVMMAILAPAEPLALERSWSQAMYDLQTPLLTDLALVFNWLGRGSAEYSRSRSSDYSCFARTAGSRLPRS